MSDADDPPSRDPGAPFAEGATDPETVARLLRSRLGTGPLDLPVTGTSMGATIQSGSTVHLPGLSEPHPGEVWAFVGARTGIVVHRVRHLTAESMTGRGDGNPLDDHTVPRSHLIGRVDSATSPGGSVREFGLVDRCRAALLMQMRGVARKLIGPARRRRRPTDRH